MAKRFGDKVAAPARNLRKARRAEMEAAGAWEFARGNELYDKGDYISALAEYEVAARQPRAPPRPPPPRARAAAAAAAAARARRAAPSRADRAPRVRRHPAVRLPQPRQRVQGRALPRRGGDVLPACARPGVAHRP